MAAADPLAEVLGLVRPHAVLAAEVRAHGPWHLAFAGHREEVKFGYVVDGHCLFALRGRRPRALRAGDVFLLGGPPPYEIGSHLEGPAQDGNELFRRATRPFVRLGSGRAVPGAHLVGGRFVLDAVNAHLLVAALPSFASIPADEAGPLRRITELLVDEVRAAHPGRERTLGQLAQLLLTYALRWLEGDGDGPARTGWLRALGDPRIGAALRHIHANVATGTSLAELARVAGMSRSAFAVRFKELVGRPALAYAIAWRMALAKDALRTTGRAIGELAFALGYESESAFSTAFRREVGRSPRAYRRAFAEPREAPEGRRADRESR